MHIGFSFKPKTLLIVLAVTLGIVAYGVEAFADPLDEDPTPAAELLTDEPASDADTDTSGLAASVQSIFGEYQPLMATDSAGNVSAVPGLAGVDFCWIGGCLAFLILFYSFFRLLGGVFLGRSK